MIIYLDESKQLAEGKIVIGGFITKHKTSYINKYVINKKKQYGFKNIEIELKSIKNTGKNFYESMIKDNDFKIISNNIIGISIDGYYRDNKKQYIEILTKLIGKIYSSIIDYNKDITIIADEVILLKKTRKVELEIEQTLNYRFPLKNKHKFNFVNSKSFGGVQIADLIAYQLRKVNISGEENFDDFISNNSFNINLKEITKI